MDDDARERWNRKHSERRGEPLVAAPFLHEALALLRERPPRGVRALDVARPRALVARPRALDVACGRGRHALALARAGFDVTAVDVSDVAVEDLSRAAEGGGLRVRAVRRDLERDGLPPGEHDLVVVVHYLQRSLFEPLERALAPGGALVFETFTVDFAEATGFPRAYCLEKGELGRAFPSLDALLLREAPDEEGRAVASLVATRR